MFIKLNFHTTDCFNSKINDETEERIIKISRIQEIRKIEHGLGSEVLISGETGFLPVKQTVDEIFGAVSK
jgi:hypothetical protein